MDGGSVDTWLGLRATESTMGNSREARSLQKGGWLLVSEPPAVCLAGVVSFPKVTSGSESTLLHDWTSDSLLDYRGGPLLS